MEPPRGATALVPSADLDPAGIALPVHGAPEALDACLAAVEAHTPLAGDAGHPLVLVLDGPQPASIEEVLERRLPQLAGARLERLARRAGFAAAANRGIAALAGRDVVLLNSDVEVPAGWLERLTAAARSAPRVASATPLTNHGTLASVPRWFAENALPAGHDLASFAALVERVSERRYPRIPTGVGFCLYLRRQALDEVGGFDEDAFGLGYGEEVDWCLRATGKGFHHVLDDATYVFHRGGASFGGESGRRSRAAQRVLERRHPGYRRRIAAFLRAEPLKPVLHQIHEALQPPRGPASGPALRLVHVVHGWPPWNHAGTETYAARLVRDQATRHHAVVYGRFAPADRPFGHALESVDGGARVRLVANRFTQRDPLSRNALEERRFRRDFGRLLDEVRPDLVHVHHLAGHCLTLTREAVRRGVPIVWQLQDWWLLCARSNRLDFAGRLCPGPTPARCAECLPATRLPPADLASRALYVLRARLARRTLAAAAAYVAGSRALVDDFLARRLLAPGVPVHVLDYGAPTADRRGSPRTQGAPLRVGFLGTLAPHKGLHVLAEAVAGLPPDTITVDVWGEPRGGDYAREARERAGAVELRFREPFAEADRAAVFAGLDLLVAPSLGLESYGLAVAEALAAGIPVLVSDRGALPERVAKGGGVTFDPERPEELARLLRRAIAEPAFLATLREGIHAPGSLADHAAAIERVYAEVLATPGRAVR